MYGEGKVGKLEGCIYDFELIDELPVSGFTIYGMDFGFTNDPTACVRLVVDTGRKEVGVQQVIYRERMLNADIIEALRLAGVPERSVPIYADCAEPKSIEEISRAGFNIRPCDKDAPVRSNKLRFQLQFVQGWRLKVTKDSVDLIKELRNYVWAQDKDGRPVNYPIDKFNHALDALRYALWTHCAGGVGQYSVSI